MSGQCTAKPSRQQHSQATCMACWLLRPFYEAGLQGASRQAGGQAVTRSKVRCCLLTHACSVHHATSYAYE